MTLGPRVPGYGTGAIPGPELYAATVLERCDRLATFSEEIGRLTRRFATDALREAGAAVAGWMREAGMTTHVDPIGNVIARFGAGTRTLLLGSHLDTVRDAGRYDGMLGVLVAIACVERLRDAGREVPFAIEVLGFADEEGARYGTAYLGSSVVAGTFDPACLERRDADGIAMADAIRAAGGDPERLSAARRDPADLIGYCEVHIEQGPVLEAEGVPVGVVTAIAGQTRARVRFEGVAGHAGTVPMDLRQDALCAAAEWIAEVEALARGEAGLVATVGELKVEPSASNVIPAQTTLSLDVRHRHDDTRAAAVERLRERATAIAGERDVTARWAIVQETPAVACSPALTDLLAKAVAGGEASRPGETSPRPGGAGPPADVLRLTSGAGHDAAVMSRIAPVAMLFVRCAGGVSHHPDEAVSRDDVAAAIEAMGRFLDLIATEHEETR